jgi:hypothetical protein
VQGDPVSEPSYAREDEIERLLADQGHDLGFARARVAFGRSGIAFGFPRDPMVHVSWWALAALAAIAGLGLAYRRWSR